MKQRTLEEMKLILTKHKQEFIKKYHMINIGVFGSRVWNDGDSGS